MAFVIFEVLVTPRIRFLIDCIDSMKIEIRY